MLLVHFKPTSDRLVFLEIYQFSLHPSHIFRDSRVTLDNKLKHLHVYRCRDFHSDIPVESPPVCLLVI